MIRENQKLRIAPVVSYERDRIGVRITHPDAQDSAEFLTAVSDAFSGFPGTVFVRCLQSTYTELDGKWTWAENSVLEVPSEHLTDEGSLAPLRNMRSRGLRLALRGRTDKATKHLLDLFECAIIHESDDKRKSEATQGDADEPGRRMPFIIDGCTTIPQANAAFERGAIGCIDWTLTAGQKERAHMTLEPAQRSALRLYGLVKEGADSKKIENILSLAPAVNARLLSYLNCKEMRSEKSFPSVSEAITGLGHAGLLKWIVLLLVTASKETENKPLIQQSLQRAFFLESMGDSEESSRDLFMVGALSLADKILSTPYEELWKSMALTEDVRAAVTGNATSKYHPTLQLALSLESDGIAAQEDVIAPRTMEDAVRAAGIACSKAASLAALN